MTETEVTASCGHAQRDAQGSCSTWPVEGAVLGSWGLAPGSVMGRRFGRAYGTGRGALVPKLQARSGAASERNAQARRAQLSGLRSVTWDLPSPPP